MIDLHRHKYAHTHGLPWYQMKTKEEIQDCKMKACENLGESSLFKKKRTDEHLAAHTKLGALRRGRIRGEPQRDMQSEPPVPHVNPMMNYLSTLKPSDTPDYDLIRVSNN